MTYAIAICTLNRPDDLARTIASIDAQSLPGPTTLVVVDASDASNAARNAQTVEQSSLASTHHRYERPPSSAAQRNTAIDLLPPSVEVVFFLDDDVTLHPGYFVRLAECLESDPEIVGVGSQLGNVPDRYVRSRRERRLRGLFFLDHPEPGRLLPSGRVSLYYDAPHTEPFPVDWLPGCACAIKRWALDRERFDEALQGYALFEDRDLSVRLARHGRLFVEPRAVLDHHMSPVNRLSAERFQYRQIVNLRWIVGKCIAHPFGLAAYWWSVFGQALILLAAQRNGSEIARAALRGFLRGVRAVLLRDDPLLQPDAA